MSYTASWKMLYRATARWFLVQDTSAWGIEIPARICCTPVPQHTKCGSWAYFCCSQSEGC